MAGENFIHGIEIVEINDQPRPISTARASVIGLIGTSGKLPVNEPVAILGSRRMGVERAGEYRDDGFTIPEALDGIYDNAGATVVCVNVCDPTKHYSEVDDETVRLMIDGKCRLSKGYVSSVFIHDTIKTQFRFINGLASMPAGIKTLESVQNEAGDTTFVMDTDYTFANDQISMIAGGAMTEDEIVTVTYTADLVEGEDYTLNPDTGEISIVGMSGSKILGQSDLIVDYRHVDPSKVTQADIIGGSDGLKYTGVRAFMSSESTVFLTPRILIAPYFTRELIQANTANPVAKELVSVAEKLRAFVYCDAPLVDDATAIAYRNMFGSRRIMVNYSHDKVLSPSNEVKLQPHSIRRAGIAAKTINEEGFWVSPSNHEIHGSIGVEPAIEFSIGDPESRSNYLNSHHVTVVIHETGFRTWGNRTCSHDPKWAFESVVRTNDMILESIQKAHLWAVDNNITKNFVESIIESVNAYMRHLKAIGAILGGEAWLDRELNTPDQIQQGKLYVDFDFTPPYPAEHIIFRAHLVNGYIKDLFDFDSSDSTYIRSGST